MVEFLLNKNADINIASSTEGITAIMKACKNGHNRVVELLMARGVHLNAVDKVCLFFSLLI